MMMDESTMDECCIQVFRNTKKQASTYLINAKKRIDELEAKAKDTQRLEHIITLNKKANENAKKNYDSAMAKQEKIQLELRRKISSLEQEIKNKNVPTNKKSLPTNIASVPNKKKGNYHFFFILGCYCEKKIFIASVWNCAACPLDDILVGQTCPGCYQAQPQPKEAKEGFFSGVFSFGNL
jgi:hypothetical protein